MKKPITLVLACCLVLSMTVPVSAGDYFFCEDVNADDFTNALVDYCNGNTVHTMTKYEFKLSNHDFRGYDVMRTDDSLEFRFDCEDLYGFFPIPLPLSYRFEGVMHVDNPQDGMKIPYTLAIFHDDTRFIAKGENWRLEVWNTCGTRFKR